MKFWIVLGYCFIGFSITFQLTSKVINCFHFWEWKKYPYCFDLCCKYNFFWFSTRLIESKNLCFFIGCTVLFCWLIFGILFQLPITDFQIGGAQRNSTLICVPIMAESVDQMLVQMRKAKELGGDLVEVRVDFLKNFIPRQDLDILIKQAPLPTLVTFR